MGLIRKSLFLGTGGLGPNWNSNKERTRKAAEKSARIQGEMLKQQRAAAAPVAPSSSATPTGLDSPGRLARAARQDARARAQRAEGQAAASARVVSELGRLVELHKAGALTDDEFAAAKAKVLGS